jgi:hypothetical protein
VSSFAERSLEVCRFGPVTRFSPIDSHTTTTFPRKSKGGMTIAVAIAVAVFARGNTAAMATSTIMITSSSISRYVFHIDVHINVN